MDSKRWKKIALSQQLGHVASELSRARHWDEKNDKPNRDCALERALGLLDLTIADKRWRLRLKEILRLREVVCDWMFGQKDYNIAPNLIEQYCLDFLHPVRENRRF